LAITLAGHVGAESVAACRIGDDHPPALRDEVRYQAVQRHVRVATAVNVNEKVFHRLRLFQVEQFDVEGSEGRAAGADFEPDTVLLELMMSWARADCPRL